MVSLGYTSRIILCQAVTLNGTDQISDGTFTVYIKAKEPEFGISFDSKIKQTAFGKSRVTPDVKYKQSVTISDAVLLSHEVNQFTEWLMDRYIAKAMIYIIVNLSDSTGSTYHNKSFYTKTQTKVKYLKGTLDNLKIKMEKGRIVRCSFKFLECSD